MLKSLNNSLSVIIFAFAFIFTSNSLSAHACINTVDRINSKFPQNDDFAAKHAKDLQNRLGLTDGQANQIASILSDYRDSVQNNNQDNSMSNSDDLSKPQMIKSFHYWMKVRKHHLQGCKKSGGRVSGML